MAFFISKNNSLNEPLFISSRGISLIFLANILSGTLTISMYPRQESNLHLELRRFLFYPLNYGGLTPTWFRQHNSLSVSSVINLLNFTSKIVESKGKSGYY